MHLLKVYPLQPLIRPRAILSLSHLKHFESEPLCVEIHLLFSDTAKSGAFFLTPVRKPRERIHWVEIFSATGAVPFAQPISLRAAPQGSAGESRVQPPIVSEATTSHLKEHHG